MRRLLFLVLALTVAAPLHAQSLGETSFPNSGAPEAQEPFLRGLLLLHSFEYVDAREAFQEARRLDPDFAMAAWGEAMTHNHPIWQEQDREAARAALDGIPTDALTARERAYLHTLDVLYGEGEKEPRDDAYAEAMAELAADHPDDLDAAAFFALALLGTAHEGRDFATYMRAAAVAEEVFAQNPQHPGAAHYLIHAYDDPVHAPLGLRPARVYDAIAPDASHALHMPSHIYVALGMWDEAAEMNRRSFEAARDRDVRRGEPVGGHGWHALYWRAYAELQRGRFAEAERLFALGQQMHAEAPSRRSAYHLGAMRAGYIVETEAGDGEIARLALALEEGSESTRLRDAFATGLAALRRDDRYAATSALTEARSLRDAITEPGLADRATVLQLEGLLLLDAGQTEAALEALREAAALEAEMPLDFGPPDPVKPAHELLGEVLLAQGRTAAALGEVERAQRHAAEAQDAFETALARAPQRVLALRGLAAAADANGDAETAARAAADLQSIRAGADASVRERAAR